MKIEFVRISRITPYLFTVVLIFLTNACQVASGGEMYFMHEKIGGVSFVAANEEVTTEDIVPIKRLGTNWVSLMPYGFVRKTEHILQYNLTRQWIGETNKGLIAVAELCKQEGLKVMIKPHVWLREGAYTGDYLPPDTSMTAFKDSFEEFVLDYARIAQEVNADMYCIGTEWQNFIKHNPVFWHELISKVKHIYLGPLTYAANWDEYMSTPFWGELNYIGVNAYFPLSVQDYPTLEDLSVGWQPWVDELNSVADKYAKPILFTEYGYRSTVKNASKPWESYTKLEISLANQQTAYQALYKEFWQQPWFAGGFAWKWFHNHEQHGGDTNSDYTPQNKPVEDVIKTFYTNPE